MIEKPYLTGISASLISSGAHSFLRYSLDETAYAFTLGPNWYSNFHEDGARGSSKVLSTPACRI